MLDASKVLQLIALTELKEHQVVCSLSKSTKRQLTSHNKWGEFEKLLFRYLEKLARTEKIWEEEEFYADFLEQLIKNAKTYNASSIFHIFPFKCWAESKFQQKSIGTCVQQQLSELGSVSK